MFENDLDLQEAIDICRAFGYEVIPKDKIHRLSFSRVDTKMSNYSRLSKEELDRINDEDAYQRIFEELKQKKLIRKSSRKDNLFQASEFYESPEMIITTWSINIIE